MIRRKLFLQALGASGAAALAFGPNRACIAAADDPILVIIAQVGGCDLLSSVIPLEQYGPYRDLRRPVVQPYDPVLRLTIDEHALQATRLNGSFALHPRMQALHKLYADGNVAVVLGVGIPDSDSNRLSHEAAKFDWQTASINRLGIETSGWVAQGMRADTNGRLPRMISTDVRVPQAFQSQSTTALSIGATIEEYTFIIPAGSNTAGASRADLFARLQTRAENPLVRDATGRAIHYANELAEIARENPASDYPKGDDGELDPQLKSIARLIASGAGSRTYFAVQNGYDTHAEQNRTLPDLLASFSSSIARFYKYLQHGGLSSRVVVLTTTDFGRRVLSDSSFGTDHGTASVNFLIGDRVRGGIYGEFPDLRRLDQDKNLAVPVDFRRMLATGATHLGIDLPDFARGYAPLGVLR